MKNILKQNNQHFEKVADMVKAKDSNVDMRCIFDGLDFIPTEVILNCFLIQSSFI